MNNITIIFFTITLASCQQPEASGITQSKENELKTFFLSRVNELDTAARLDSFNFIRMDTITQSDKYLVLTSGFLDKIDENHSRFDLEEKQINLIKSKMRLYAQVSEQLFEDSKEEGQEHLDSLKAIHERGAVLINKMNYYDSLSKIADSIKPIGYKAVCLYQVRARDQSVKKDTAFITMNLDKNIVDSKTIYKED